MEFTYQDAEAERKETMILICTKHDLTNQNEEMGAIKQAGLNEEAFRASLTAEDVYFWRDGEAKPLKRRNAPLVVPDWLKDLEGVDR